MQDAGRLSTKEERSAKSLLDLRRRKWYGMSQILPYLYLGGLCDANDVEQLKDKQIDYVVSIHELSERIRMSKNLNILRIQMADVPGANISEYFAETATFIHHARLSKKSVLVHCIAGVSRSVCIVAAYLIAACDMTYAAALAHIISKRPCANPNFGFRMQLVKYAEKRGSLEKMIRDQFGSEAFDELKANDKKVLLEFTITTLPDALDKSFVCKDTKSPSANIPIKDESARSVKSAEPVKYQCNSTVRSVFNDSSIEFIDQ